VIGKRKNITVKPRGQNKEMAKGGSSTIENTTEKLLLTAKFLSSLKRDEIKGGRKTPFRA